MVLDAEWRVDGILELAAGTAGDGSGHPGGVIEAVGVPGGHLAEGVVDFAVKFAVGADGAVGG